MPAFNELISEEAKVSERRFEYIVNRNNALFTTLRTFSNFRIVGVRRHKNTFIKNDEVASLCKNVAIKIETDYGSTFEVCYIDIHWYDGYNFCNRADWGSYYVYGETAHSDEPDFVCTEDDVFAVLRSMK